MSMSAEAGAGVATAPKAPEPTLRVENPAAKLESRKQRVQHLGRSLFSRPSQEVARKYSGKELPKDDTENALYLYGKIAGIPRPEDDQKHAIGKSGINVREGNPMFVELVTGTKGNEYLPADAAGSNRFQVLSIDEVQREGDFFLITIQDGSAELKGVAVSRQAILGSLVLSEENAFLSQFNEPGQEPKKQAAELYVRTLKDKGTTLTDSDDAVIKEASDSQGLMSIEDTRTAINAIHPITPETNDDNTQADLTDEQKTHNLRSQELQDGLQGKEFADGSDLAAIFMDGGGNPQTIVKNLEQQIGDLNTQLTELNKHLDVVSQTGQADEAYLQARGEVAAKVQEIQEKTQLMEMIKDKGDQLTAQYEPFFTRWQNGELPPERAQKLKEAFLSGQPKDAETVIVEMVNQIKEDTPMTPEQRNRILEMLKKGGFLAAIAAAFAALEIKGAYDDELKQKPQGFPG